MADHHLCNVASSWRWLYSRTYDCLYLHHQMRLLIWNINSLVPTVRNFVLKYGSLRGFFDTDTYQADIICFQETKLMEEKMTKDLACVEGFQSFWATSREKRGYSGVATYTRETWAPLAAEADCLGDSAEDLLSREGRIVVTDHGAFVLLNVYVPNAGKRGEELSARADLKIRFLRALKAMCDTFAAEGKQVVIVGDLNIAASQQDVHSGLTWAQMYHPEEKAILAALLQDYTDVWRMQHPRTQNAFTVWDERTNARYSNKGVRIDYVLVSHGLLPHCGPCTILDTPPKWSDHSALLMEFHGLSPPKPHPPAPLWSKCLQRFTNPSQPSVASFFSRKKALQGAKSAGAEQEEVALQGAKSQTAEAKQQQVAEAGKVEEGRSAVCKDSREAKAIGAKLASSVGLRAGGFGADVPMRAGEVEGAAVNQVDAASREARDEMPAEAVECSIHCIREEGCKQELPDLGECSHVLASNGHQQYVGALRNEQAAECIGREEDGGGGRLLKRAKLMAEHADTVGCRAAELDAATSIEMHEDGERGAVLEPSHCIVEAEAAASAGEVDIAKNLDKRLQSRGSGRGSRKQSRTEQSPKASNKGKRQLGIRAFFHT